MRLFPYAFTHVGNFYFFYNFSICSLPKTLHLGPSNPKQAWLEAPEAWLEAPEAWLEAHEAWLEAHEAWFGAPEALLEAPEA